ncbi:universal stress protein [Martelella alba]|nr:universal stress protein [Martelella alba]
MTTFTRIMAPVDLAHLDRLKRALDIAADLSGFYGAPVTYVGISAATPGALGHNPAEFAEKLRQFADLEGNRRGIATASHPVITHDPARDLNPALAKAVETIGADLVVMATHIPNIADHFWPSHGGALSQHTKASVFLVRP